MFDLYDVVITFVFLLLIFGIYHIALLREQAYKAATHHCRKLDLQLLDQNVAIKAVWFKRDKNGSLRFWLSFDFEFSSTGDERYTGKIVFLGGRVANIVLPPYRLPDTDAQL